LVINGEKKGFFVIGRLGLIYQEKGEGRAFFQVELRSRVELWGKTWWGEFLTSMTKKYK